MKHKKEKKDKTKKKGRTSLLASHHEHHSASQHSSTLGSSSGQLDQAQTAYRWEKLSPAEFEQLQDLASCKLLRIEH